MIDSRSPQGEDKEPERRDSPLFTSVTVVGDENLQLKLLQTLLDENIISPAQAQLLLADQEVTGMTIAEVVVARGWLTESRLDEIAPWHNKQAQQAGVLTISAGSKNYSHNFAQYRSLMEKILGLGWD